MKNRRKLFVIVPLCVTAAGLIIGSVGLLMGGIGDYKNSLRFGSFEARIPSDGIYNIVVDSELADINIISTVDSDDFGISADNVTKDIIEYTTGNNTLRLSYKKDKWYDTIFLPEYYSRDGVIDLYLPAKTKLRDVEINVTHDDVSIKYLTAERVFINTEKGSTAIRDMKCGYADIESSGTSVEGVNIKADNADLNFSCDSARLENFSSKSPVLSSDGCDTDIKGVLDGDCSFLSDGGSVNVKMYGKSSDYAFNDLSGDLLVNGNAPASAGKAKYTVKTKGQVSIELK